MRIKRNLWDRYWKTSSLKRRLIEMFREVYFAGVFSGQVKKFLKGNRVLEAGCGSAKILERLGSGYVGVGCDLSYNAVKEAKDSCRHLVVCDIKKLPFKDNSFDLVFNQGVMEHFSDSEAIGILDEFKRVSNDVLIIVPANTSIFRIYNPFEEETPGASFFSRKRLKAILEKRYKNVKASYIPGSFFISMAGYGSG